MSSAEQNLITRLRLLPASAGDRRRGPGVPGAVRARSPRPTPRCRPSTGRWARSSRSRCVTSSWPFRPRQDLPARARAPRCCRPSPTPATPPTSSSPSAARSSAPRPDRRRRQHPRLPRLSATATAVTPVSTTSPTATSTTGTSTTGTSDAGTSTTGASTTGHLHHGDLDVDHRDDHHQRSRAPVGSIQIQLVGLTRTTRCCRVRPCRSPSTSRTPATSQPTSADRRAARPALESRADAGAGTVSSPPLGPQRPGFGG